MLLVSVAQDAVIRRPFLSPIFSDHMVLQRGRPNTFWGWTEPGQHVRVAIEGQSAEGVSGADGKWMVKVSPPKVGGPYKIVVSGPQRLTLTDVLVGDVWLCGGQSNMQFGLAASLNGREEVAAANHSQIRFALVPVSMSFHPRDFTTAPWKVCTPETVGNDAWNGLSAVGYFFGRALQKELKIPIGLVHDCRGGSRAESWISRPTLEGLGYVNETLGSIDEADRTHHAEYMKNAEDWIQRSDAGSMGNAWANPDLDDTGWNKVSLPASYSDLGFGGHLGVTWFRTEIDLPQTLPAGDATLSLGAIADADWTWVNGNRVGSTAEYRLGRNYAVSSAMLRPGRNQITVRVLSTGVTDGFMSPGKELLLKLADGTQVPLANGNWRVKQGLNLWEGKGEFPWGIEGAMSTPLVHYNSMIYPVAPLAVRGAIWYQGESNAYQSRPYVQIMQDVAKDWRAAFETDNFPFLQVQLANFQARGDQPGDSAWAALREAQWLSSRKIPGGGLVTAVDIGDAADIHPKNKRDVGIRLANLALKQVYGRSKIVASGPIFRSFRIEGSSLRVRFEATNGGLAVHGPALKGFSLAGSDRKFYWADAKIVGNEVVLTSAEVKVPVAARYAWADNPEITLYNGAGLPAFPFRTDNWPVH